MKWIVIFLLWSCNVFAVELDVKLAQFDTNYTLGDKIQLQYTVRYDANLHFIPPDFSNISPHFELLESKFDSTTNIFSVTLISFDTGTFDLPAVPFLFEDMQSKRLFTKLSPTNKIQINSIKITSNNIKELPFQPLEEQQWNWLGIGIMIVILIAIVVMFGIKFIKINKKNIC